MSKEVTEVVKHKCDICYKEDIVPHNKTDVYLGGTSDYSHYAYVNISLQLAYSRPGEKHVCKECAKTILEDALKEIEG